MLRSKCRLVPALSAVWRLPAQAQESVKLNGPATFHCGWCLVNWQTRARRDAQYGRRKILINAAQCRSARTLLTWSVSKLANAASVSDSAIDDFELERRQPPPAALEAIQRAFEEVGIRFLPGDDVRLGADV